MIRITRASLITEDKYTSGNHVIVNLYGQFVVSSSPPKAAVDSKYTFVPHPSHILLPTLLSCFKTALPAVQVDADAGAASSSGNRMVRSVTTAGGVGGALDSASIGVAVPVCALRIIVPPILKMGRVDVEVE